MDIMQLPYDRRSCIVEMLRTEFPKGTEVELVLLNDPYSRIPVGTKGVVQHVDDIATIHIHWSNGSQIGVIFGVDKIRKIQ